MFENRAETGFRSENLHPPEAPLQFMSSGATAPLPCSGASPAYQQLVNLSGQDDGIVGNNCVKFSGSRRQLLFIL
jgi:hypothetical protein